MEWFHPRMVDLNLRHSGKRKIGIANVVTSVVVLAAWALPPTPVSATSKTVLSVIEQSSDSLDYGKVQPNVQKEHPEIKFYVPLTTTFTTVPTVSLVAMSVRTMKSDVPQLVVTAEAIKKIFYNLNITEGSIRLRTAGGWWVYTTTEIVGDLNIPIAIGARTLEVEVNTDGSQTLKFVVELATKGPRSTPQWWTILFIAILSTTLVILGFSLLWNVTASRRQRTRTALPTSATRW